MAKPTPTKKEQLQGTKGKGKGIRDYGNRKGKGTFLSKKNDLDYEHAGVGIAKHHR